MKNSDIKKYARKSLFKNFGISIGMGFLILLLFALMPFHGWWLLAMIPLFILPLIAGMQWFYAHLYQGELKNVALVYDPATGDMVMPDHVSPHRPRIALLFQPFQLGLKYYLKIVAVQLLLLPLIAPWSLMYSQVLFLVMSNPELRIFEAFKQSRQLMIGKKRKHYLGSLSTLVWLLIPSSLLVGLYFFALTFSTYDLLLQLMIWGLGLLVVNLLIGLYFLLWHWPYYLTYVGGFHRELVGDDWEEFIRPKRQPLFAKIMLGIGIAIAALSPNGIQLGGSNMVSFQAPFWFFNPASLLTGQSEPAFSDLPMGELLGAEGAIGQEIDLAWGFTSTYLYFPDTVFAVEDFSDRFLIEWSVANRDLTDNFNWIQLELSTGNRLLVTQTIPDWDLAPNFLYQVFDAFAGEWVTRYFGIFPPVFSDMLNPFGGFLIWTEWRPDIIGTVYIASPFGGERERISNIRYYSTYTPYISYVLDEIPQWDLTPVPAFDAIEDVKTWAENLYWNLGLVFVEPTEWRVIDRTELINYVFDYISLPYVGSGDSILWVHVRPR